jgi:phage tail sheath protein FI
LRVNLIALDSPEAATGFVPYDSDYSNEYVKYYSSDLSYGYDGYFEVSVNDFIANLDPYVAASLVAFDPDLSDLTTVSDLISSTESTLNYDLLVIPGFSSSPVLAKTMYNICQNKQFVSCILDLPSGMTPILAINYRQSTLADIDSSKTSIFWNYAKVYDSVNKQYVWLPPSVFALRAIAYTEQTTTPFAAAAGLKRGILPNVVELEYNPKLADRDLLFTAQINPLASIQGIITVWGNKTSQKITSMLSDFNVRRMLNKAEKAVYLASQSMLFDPNDAAERQAIILSIQPIFDVIAQKRGIAEFSIADSTREEDVANGMARFTINLRPTATVRIIEYDVIVNSPNLK